MFTWEEIQWAIWHLIDDRPNGGGSNCWSQYLAAAALQYGVDPDFVPGCGEKLVKVLVPCDNLPAIGQVIISQVTVLPGTKYCPACPAKETCRTCETGYGFATDGDGQLLHPGRAVQVDSIETRVESAYGFSA